MPTLDARDRRRLPKTAFAYVDARGRGHLPIHDPAHLRAAMARFNQTRFEDEAAREHARQRILRAARRHGIVPVGFVAGLLRAQRGEVASGKVPPGDVSFLFSDIEESTGLLRRLGDRYPSVLADVRRALRAAVRAARGREVDARADEFFAVFVRADEALRAAVDIQRRLAARQWPKGERVRVRLGIHTGRAAVTDGGYVGLDVHVAARVCSVAHGGQILLSDVARLELERSSAEDAAVAGVEFRYLGVFELHGLPDPQRLHEAVAAGVQSGFPAPRTAAPSYVALGRPEDVASKS
ncbi:MAG: adenylate/guanylate cyclase domain-containing protein [Candidatus Limnocylindria bacterium]